MTTSSTAAPSQRVSRVTLLVSLALNLFFIGVEGAAAYRKFHVSSAENGVESRRTAAGLIDRIASTLPTAQTSLTPTPTYLRT